MATSNDIESNDDGHATPPPSTRRVQIVDKRSNGALRGLVAMTEVVVVWRPYWRYHSLTLVLLDLLLVLRL